MRADDWRRRMAKDSAHEFSDAEIRAFEREVAGVYGEASKTAYANLKRYLAQFEADDEKMRERLEAGEITKAQYRSWRSGKIAAGRRYRIVLKQCAEAMTHANVVAAAAIEGRLPEVYAENYNYGTWQVESAVGVDTAYALQDASTVQRQLPAKAVRQRRQGRGVEPAAHRQPDYAGRAARRVDTQDREAHP